MLDNKGVSEIFLIRKCKQGELKYQELLYKFFYSYAMGIGLRYSGSRDDSMEVVNDAFIKFFNTIATYDEERPLKPWLRRIIINATIDKRRKDHHHTDALDLEEANHLSLQPGAIDKMAADELLSLIGELPELHRLIFNLYEIDGYKHEEIGKMLNIPPSSSRVHLSRAKLQLRNAFILNEIKYHARKV